MSRRIWPLCVLTSYLGLAIGCGGGGGGGGFPAPDAGTLSVPAPVLQPSEPGSRNLAADIDSFFIGINPWPRSDDLMKVDEYGDPILDEQDMLQYEEPGDRPIESGESETILDETTQDQDGNDVTVSYQCKSQKRRLTDSFDSILSVAGNSGILWPGAIVQGRTIRDGNPAGLHLPRSSITVSIDLAIPRPSAVLKNPTSASYQEALSGFMRQADEMISAGGESADEFLDRLIPARLNFVRQEAHSFEQMLLKTGLNVKYDGAAVKGSLSAAFGLNRSSRAHTIFVRFMQPMFTVTFADEAKGRPSDYFDSEMTMDDINFEVARGTLGALPLLPDGGDNPEWSLEDDKNQACYVKSVTYGRMMMFSLTSTSVSSALDLDVAIEGQYKVFSGDASLTYQQRQTMENSTIHMMAFGGTQEDALASIRVEPIKYHRDADGNIEYETIIVRVKNPEYVAPDGQGMGGSGPDVPEFMDVERRGNPKFEDSPSGEGLNAFFKPGPASVAVPLVYRVNRLRDGLTATVSSATTYTTRECSRVDAHKKHRFELTLDRIDVPVGGRVGIAHAVGNGQYDTTPGWDSDGHPVFPFDDKHESHGPVKSLLLLPSYRIDVNATGGRLGPFAFLDRYVRGSPPPAEDLKSWLYNPQHVNLGTNTMYYDTLVKRRGPPDDWIETNPLDWQRRLVGGLSVYAIEDLDDETAGGMYAGILPMTYEFELPDTPSVERLVWPSEGGAPSLEEVPNEFQINTQVRRLVSTWTQLYYEDSDQLGLNGENKPTDHFPGLYSQGVSESTRFSYPFAMRSNPTVFSHRFSARRDLTAEPNVTFDFRLEITKYTYFAAGDP